MFCSKCGSPNDDAARFCGKCGAGLPAAAMAASAGAADAPTAPIPPPPASPQGYADPRMRGGAAPAAGYGQPAPGAQGKNPVIAVLLSFFIPGAGQMYNDQVQKGALMLGGYILSWFLAILVIGFVGVVGIWLWSMIDAYKVADASRVYARQY